MPIIKSAIKRAKQTRVRTARNVATKRTMRDAIKKVNAAVEANDGKAAAAALVEAQAAIDTAAKKNVIHKNTAARRKSSLAASVKTVSGSAPVKKAARKPAAKKPAAKKTAAKKPAAKPKAKATATKKTAAKK